MSNEKGPWLFRVYSILDYTIINHDIRIPIKHMMFKKGATVVYIRIYVTYIYLHTFLNEPKCLTKITCRSSLVWMVTIVVERRRARTWW